MTCLVCSLIWGVLRSGYPLIWGVLRFGYPLIWGVLRSGYHLADHEKVLRHG